MPKGRRTDITGAPNGWPFQTLYRRHLNSVRTPLELRRYTSWTPYVRHSDSVRTPLGLRTDATLPGRSVHLSVFRERVSVCRRRRSITACLPAKHGPRPRPVSRPSINNATPRPDGHQSITAAPGGVAAYCIRPPASPLLRLAQWLYFLLAVAPGCL